MAFETMSYYEKIAVGNAAGFKDVEEMSKALSGSVNGLSMSNARNAASMEATEKGGPPLLTLTEKIAALVPGFTPFFLPVPDGLHVFLDGVMDFIDQGAGGPFIEQLSKSVFLVGEFFILAFQAATGLGGIPRAGGGLLGTGALFSLMGTAAQGFTNILTIMNEFLESVIDRGLSGFGNLAGGIGGAGGALQAFMGLVENVMDATIGFLRSHPGLGFQVMADAIDAVHDLLFTPPSPIFFDSLIDIADRFFLIAPSAAHMAKSFAAIDVSMWIELGDVVSKNCLNIERIMGV
jgi:hypothetical protein